MIWTLVGVLVAFGVLFTIWGISARITERQMDKVKPPKIEPTPDTEEAQYWLKVRSG